MEDPLRQLLRSAGAPVRADGTVLVYHATTTCGARQILGGGVLKARAGETLVFVSTGPGIVAVLDGAEVVVPVRVELEELREQRNWLDHGDESLRRVDLAIESAEYEPIAVGRAAYDDEQPDGGPEVAAMLGL
jgi:hypothetical protein